MMNPAFARLSFFIAAAVIAGIVFVPLLRKAAVLGDALHAWGF